MLSPEYVAGFFDGEGVVSITFSKVRAWKRDPSRSVLAFVLRVGVCNTNRSILEALRTQYGGDINSNATKRKPHHKVVWAWKISGVRKQREFLCDILPYAVVKAAQIGIGLEYLDTCVLPGQRLQPEAWDTRIKLIARLRALNQRGIYKPTKNAIPNDQPQGWNPAKRNYSVEEIAEMMAHARASRTKGIAKRAHRT